MYGIFYGKRSPNRHCPAVFNSVRRDSRYLSALAAREANGLMLERFDQC